MTMTATNHTEHYGLSQYTEDDRPTYTGDYNGDMTKIDAAIHAASQAGGMTTVEHTADLTGDGTTSTPLGLTPGVVTLALPSDITDCDMIRTLGVYRCQKIMTNTPYGEVNITMVLYVYLLGGDILQLAYVLYNGIDAVNEIFIRTKVSHSPSFNPWKKMAAIGDIPDVSALTSRIAMLESQVAALTAAATPSATGLTATQLDAQYSDNYNIVRVGAPTRNTESEETSHE